MEKMNDATVFNRQLDLVKPVELDFPIAVIGAGGIGSWTVLALAKLGCRNLTVYDDDILEIENTPSQFYKTKQVGLSKVKALKTNILEMTGTKITAINSKWQFIQANRKLTDKLIISAVDSMEERHNIWAMIAEKMAEEHNMYCYIDARMGGELLSINTVSLFDEQSIADYLINLYPASKVEEEICTAKSIVYNTFFCAGIIATLVKKFAKGEEQKHNLTFDITNLSAV